ncbi:unnamed protein product, partial [Ectocarpus fasciculatus]
VLRRAVEAAQRGQARLGDIASSASDGSHLRAAHPAEEQLMEVPAGTLTFPERLRNASVYLMPAGCNPSRSPTESGRNTSILRSLDNS